MSSLTACPCSRFCHSLPMTPESRVLCSSRSGHVHGHMLREQVPESSTGSVPHNLATVSVRDDGRLRKCDHRWVAMTSFTNHPFQSDWLQETANSLSSAPQGWVLKADGGRALRRAGSGRTGRTSPRPCRNRGSDADGGSKAGRHCRECVLRAGARGAVLPSRCGPPEGRPDRK